MDQPPDLIGSPFFSFSTTPSLSSLDVAGRLQCLRQVLRHSTMLTQTYAPLPRHSNRTFNFLTLSLSHGWPIPLSPWSLSFSGYRFLQSKHKHRLPMQRVISSQLVRLPNMLQLLLPACHAIWPSPQIISSQMQSMGR